MNTLPCSVPNYGTYLIHCFPKLGADRKELRMSAPIISRSFNAAVKSKIQMESLETTVL